MPSTRSICAATLRCRQRQSKIGHKKIGHKKIGHKKIGHKKIGHKKIGHKKRNRRKSPHHRIFFQMFPSRKFHRLNFQPRTPGMLLAIDVTWPDRRWLPRRWFARLCWAW